METRVYGQNQVTGDVVSVTSGGTVAVSRGFNSTIGVVGQFDSANATATEGEVTNVPSPDAAPNLFGEGSETSRQVRLAYSNGVYDVFAIGLGATTTTETFSATQSVNLGNEVADPNVTTKQITATDTADGSSVEVSVVYDSPPATPSAADDGSVALNVNPVTREGEFSSSGSYEVTYSSGDYQTATDTIAEKNIRFLAVCSENETVLNAALSKINSLASEFDFKRVVGGANPRVNPQDYGDGLSDSRMVLVAPSRGYEGEAQTMEVRTVGAVAGTLAARPLGDTATNTQLSGFVSVHDYPSSDIAALDDAGLLTLNDSVQGIEVVRDLTTSTDERFERVYACEIVDDFAYTSHVIASQFVGRLNVPENRIALEKSLRNAAYDAEDQNLLDDSSVDVVDDGGADEVTANIGLDVVDVMDIINVDITVGPIMRFEGVSDTNVGAPTA